VWRGLINKVSHGSFSKYVLISCNLTLLLESGNNITDCLPNDVNSSALPLDFWRARSPLTSLTAVSSSILRCKSSKMPCPKRASADMMCELCCVLNECSVVVRSEAGFNLQKVRRSSNLPVNVALLSRML
jgi:hypothetical protein